jgi:S1-C subfamily serine protease
MHPNEAGYNGPDQPNEQRLHKSDRFTVTLSALLALLVVAVAYLHIPGILIGERVANTMSQNEIDEITRITQAHNDALREQVNIAQNLHENNVCKKGDNLFLPPSDNQHGSSDELLKDLKPIGPRESNLVMPLPADKLTAETKSPNGRNQRIPLPQLLDQSTVFIVNVKEGNVESIGSGFFIANDKIVTNWHVIEGDKIEHLVINKSLGKLRNAQVIAATQPYDVKSPKPDFAILKIDPFPNASILPLRKPVERLQRVVAAGYPFLVEQSDEKFEKLMNGDSHSVPELNLTNGNVTVIQEKSDGFSVIIHGAQISPGNSGGPLVDECGAIVGVNTWVQSSDNHSTNVALSSDTLAKFLADKNLHIPIDANPCSNGINN